jgi:serine/threonine-protein kinase
LDAEQFGPYRLEELIGRGGMGEVFRAFDTEKKRTVAVKRLLRHLAASEEFQARFRRESELAARLRDPHVIPIHQYGEINGYLYIEMRLVEGADLACVIKDQGRLAPQRAVNIVAQVASALDAAHTDGLVHRDVKPQNILVAGADRGDDFVYLVDFGIVRAADGHGTMMTATGATIGTVEYMAPERFLSGHGDHRVDVYALACVLLEMLTGRKPFEGEGLAAMMYSHVHLPPPRPSRLVPDVPVALDAVVERGMAKAPDERFASAGELARAAGVALEDPLSGLSRSGPSARSTHISTMIPPAPTHVSPPRGFRDGAADGHARGWVQPPPETGEHRRTWIFAGTGLLLLTLVVALVIALSGSGTSALQSAAQSYVDAINIADPNAVRRLTCPSRQAEVPTASRLARLTVELGVVVKSTDDTGVVQLSVRNVSESSSSSSSSASAVAPSNARFVRINDEWLYCGSN